MLGMEVLEGKYCNYCPDELPSAQYENATINNFSDPEMNYFSIKSRQPLEVRREKGLVQTYVGGFSGIAVIIWALDFRMWTDIRLKGELRSNARKYKLATISNPAAGSVVPGKPGPITMGL